MFTGVVEVAEELSKKVRTFQNQRDNRRVRIANFFDKIGTCLGKIVKAIDEKQSFDDRMGELDTYIQSFSSAVGDIIGFEKTDELIASLKSSLSEECFTKLKALPETEAKSCRDTLKESSERFLDLWEELN